MGVNVGVLLLSGFWFFFHVAGRKEEISNSSCVPSLSGTAKLSFQIQVPPSVIAKGGLNQGCTQSCNA